MVSTVTCFPAPEKNVRAPGSFWRLLKVANFRPHLWELGDRNVPMVSKSASSSCKPPGIQASGHTLIIALDVWHLIYNDLLMCLLPRLNLGSLVSVLVFYTFLHLQQLMQCLAQRRHVALLSIRAGIILVLSPAEQIWGSVESTHHWGHGAGVPQHQLPSAPYVESQESIFHISLLDIDVDQTGSDGQREASGKARQVLEKVEAGQCAL